MTVHSLRQSQWGSHGCGGGQGRSGPPTPGIPSPYPRPNFSSLPRPLFFPIFFSGTPAQNSDFLSQPPAQLRHNNPICVSTDDVLSIGSAENQCLQTGRIRDVVEIPQSRMATATSRPPVRDIGDPVNPPRGFDQSAMLTSYRVWDYASKAPPPPNPWAPDPPVLPHMLCTSQLITWHVMKGLSLSVCPQIADQYHGCWWPEMYLGFTRVKGN